MGGRSSWHIEVPEGWLSNSERLDLRNRDAQMIVLSLLVKHRRGLARLRPLEPGVGQGLYGS